MQGTFHAWLRVAICACAWLATNASAQDTPATDYNKRLKIWQTVSPGGETPFGERINLYTGELSFLQTDLTFPGTGPDIVVSRMTVTSLEDVPEGTLPFGNWDMNLPRIQTLVAGPIGWDTFDAAAPGGRTERRCTRFGLPYSEGATGMTMVTEDGDSQPLLRRSAQNTLRPTMTNDIGQPMVFPAVTNANWQIGCLAATTNGQRGEGFLAVSPEGVRYSFTHLTYADSETIIERDNDSTIRTLRDLAKMYVTKIEDRFGNKLDFVYSGSKLTRILASDGRRVDFTWRTDAEVISAVTMHATDAPPRTWQYQYKVYTEPKFFGTVTKALLTRVVLPDASTWQFTGIVGAVYAAPTHSLLNKCTTRDASPLGSSTPASGSVTSPGGLVGTFEITRTWHGRSYVVSKCETHAGSSELTEGVPPIFGAMALTKRTISGDGVPARTWSYAYSAAQGSTDDDACAAAGSCPESAWVDVVDPAGDRTRHWYSTRWGVSEGRSTKVETFDGATLLRTQSLAYAAPTGNAWPARVGHSLNAVSTNIAKQEHWTPVATRTIAQQGVTFTWSATRFDALARPAEEFKRSSLGHSKTDTTAYHDLLPAWTLGQVARTTTNGIETASSTFDARALPVQRRDFGKLQHTLAYNANGTVASMSDGRDTATFDTTVLFSGWKRGIPGKIVFPDKASKSAAIDDLGQIRAVTDEVGAKTCYDFDLMARVSKITYPSESTSGVCDGSATAAWLPTTTSFTKGHAAAYGLPAGHWRRTTHTGNQRSVTFFDALWRPVVEQVVDLGDVAGTLQETFNRYDHDGNVVFASYPMNSAGQARYDDASLKGTRTSHDALGRVIRTVQDSELGALATTTQYVAGFKTQVTNPRGKITTTSHYAWDAPDTAFPRDIVHPGDAITHIVRDAFGKPTTITRRNAASTVWQRRYRTYDAHQQLCKRMEVESGTTLLQHDAAGNLAGSASGLPWSDPTKCNDVAAPALRWIARAYDQRNRPKSVTYGDGKGNATYGYHADGALASLAADNGDGTIVTSTYAYNRRRLLTGETLRWGPVHWPVAYTYDKRGHLATQAWHALSVDYAPNALGQPTKAGPYAANVKYHPNGAMASFTYGNGIAHTLVQNARGLPDTSRDNFGATDFLKDAYDYDANGNVAAISDGLPGARGNRTMQYDDLDRLASVASPMYGGAIAFTYDAADQLRTVTKPGGVHLRYCYGGGDAVLKFIRSGSTNCNDGAATTTFAFSTQGNMTAKNADTYDFDVGNRLRAINGGAKGRYRYDGHGRRVWDSTTGDRFSHYSLDGRLLLTSDVRAGKVADYIQLNGTLLAIRERDIATNAFTTKYQHNDALGSPVVVTNQNRVVLERNEYEPFGKVLNRAPRDGVGYTGHVEDAASGLTYMQQRYYDAQWGVFTSVDPVSVDTTTGWNFCRYCYAALNPYKFKDPDGRIIDTVVDVGFIVYDIVQIARTGATAANMSALGADVAGLLVPGFTGGGMMVRAASHGADAARVTAKELRATGRGDYAAARGPALADNGGKCNYCSTSDSTQGDHVKSLKAFAGDVNSGKMTKQEAAREAHASGNVVGACAQCNGGSQKGAKELSATPGEGKWVPPNPSEQIKGRL